MSTVNSAGLSGDEVKKIVTDSIKSAKTAITELWDVGTKFDGEIKCGTASAAQNFLMPVGTVSIRTLQSKRSPSRFWKKRHKQCTIIN